jgi:hypothetical protein
MIAEFHYSSELARVKIIIIIKYKKTGTYGRDCNRLINADIPETASLQIFK